MTDKTGKELTPDEYSNSTEGNLARPGDTASLMLFQTTELQESLELTRTTGGVLLEVVTRESWDVEHFPRKVVEWHEKSRYSLHLSKPPGFPWKEEATDERQNK